MPVDPVAAARALADEVLLPDAVAVDGADRVPAAHLEALDAAGLTGLAAAHPDPATRIDVIAALAGGCLATAFVHLQHQGALAGVAGTAWAPRLATGEVRGGVAITALRGASPLRLVDGALRGTVPWVTGWGIVDVLRVAALDERGDVATALIDARPSASLAAERLHLVAAQASRTSTLRFDGLAVPVDRRLAVVPPDEWWAGDAAGLAGNGALALGVAGRAAALAGSDRLADEVRATRAALLGADVAGLPAARAACSTLAVRAAAALAVHDGARSAMAGGHAERLVREAQFLSVFGSRPAIRSALLADLGA